MIFKKNATFQTKNSKDPKNSSKSGFPVKVLVWQKHVMSIQKKTFFLEFCMQFSENSIKD
jgi:hypothetical protein